MQVMDVLSYSPNVTILRNFPPSTIIFQTESKEFLWKAESFESEPKEVINAERLELTAKN